MTARNYRADIDGLRAIAVVPVVLFHAHAPFVTGGYVGVDVFFVISGFLITSLIAAEIDRGAFSIVTFYERRVRRIFPAFFAVIAASAAAAWLLLPPSSLQDFGYSAIAAAGFASNVLFFAQADYFDAPAHMKPLLHTWSLAVEEQFYIVFPLFLMALHRFGKGRFRVVILAVLSLASFIACVYATSANPAVGRQVGQAAAFYLAPFRAWELALGSLLALGAVPRVRAPVLREAAALVGMALIAYAVFAFTERTAFPGAAALAPVAGAALIIHAGAHDTTLVTRALAAAPVVFVGKVSYSLYLWHWPLLIFAGLWSIEPLDAGARAALVLASFAAAVLSWRFVENPVRNRALFARRRSLFAGAAVCTAALVAGAWSAHATGGWPTRVSEEARALDAARADRNTQRSRCHADDKRPIAFDEKCVYGAAAARARPTVAIWGDSFAAELAVALGEEAERRGTALLYISHSGCPPGLGLFESERPVCAAHNREMVQRLSESASSVHTVILVARYEAYTDAVDGFLPAFERAAHALATAGKSVVVTWPIPKPPSHVPTLLARAAQRGHDPHDVAIDRGADDRRNSETLASFERLLLARHLSAARVADALCSKDRCPLILEDDVLFFDENHLSVAGARRALPAFAHAFAKSDGPP